MSDNNQPIVPGEFHCPECGFVVTKNILYVNGETIGADTADRLEPCPNDGTIMRPVLYLDALNEARKLACESMMEVRHLRELLAKLPKTADGVPIVYGMTVWYFDEEAETPVDATWFGHGDFVSTTVTAVYTKGFSEYVGDVTVGVAGDWEGGNLEVFSTREAAIAFTEKGRKAS